MTIREAQERVDQWIRTFGVRYFSELTNLALLMEETGELARIMARTYGEQSAKPAEQNKPLAEEMADVLFVLICPGSWFCQENGTRRTKAPGE